jgi:hypothetical protein
MKNTLPVPFLSYKPVAGLSLNLFRKEEIQEVIEQVRTIYGKWLKRKGNAMGS